MKKARILSLIFLTAGTLLWTYGLYKFAHLIYFRCSK